MTNDEKIQVTVNTFITKHPRMSAEDGEDIMQEARFACWRWMERNPEEDLGEGLVTLLTQQECRDYERKTRAAREQLPLWSEDKEEATEEGNAEYDAQLANILGKIVNDEHEARVALAVIASGLTIRETALVLDRPRSDIHRTLALLRQRARELGVLGE